MRMHQWVILILTLSPGLVAQQVGAQTPRINSGGIVNGASFAPNVPVAPGSIVSVFGTDLTNRETAWAESTPLRRELAGTTLLMNGIPAPLYFVSPLQINAQVPWELRGGTYSVSVELQTPFGAVRSNEIPVSVSPTAPGVFTLDATGSGSCACLDANDFGVIRPARPAMPGDVIAIYATGLGVVDSNSSRVTGQAPAELTRTLETPRVFIDELPAEVLFSGLAPGFVGLYQVNVVIPQFARPGSRVPLVVKTALNTSNPVTVAIAGDASQSTGIFLEKITFIDFGGLRDSAGTVAIDPQDNIYACGFKANTATDQVGACVSVNQNLDERWRFTFGATSSIIRDMVRDPLQNTFYFTGQTVTGDPRLTSALLGQFDANGRMLLDPFHKSFQINSNTTEGRLIRMLGSEAFIGVNVVSDPYIVVTDLSGNIKRKFLSRGCTFDPITMTGLWVGLNRVWMNGDVFIHRKNAGYVRVKSSISGEGLLCDAAAATPSIRFNTSIVGDNNGLLYLAGTEEAMAGDPKTRTFLLEKSDSDQGIIQWIRTWNGDNPNANERTLAHNVVLSPTGAIAVIGQLTEIRGANVHCTTYPDCTDFGIWIVNPDRTTLKDNLGREIGKVRLDLNNSPIEVPWAAAFDSQGRLVVVGTSVKEPTATARNQDFIIMRFRIVR